MKPSSSKSKKGITIGIVLAIVILASLGGYAYYAQAFFPAETANKSAVQTAVVQRGDLVVSASGSGTLIASSEASFGFEASGQVAQVNVKVGDQVEAGQVLAELDDTLAQMDYAEAQQALQELYSAASIAAVRQEIATAQDTESYAREWLEYLLSPEVVAAEDEVAKAEQALADAQEEAKANPSDAATQKVKECERALAFLQDKLTQTQTYYQNVYLPENFGEYEQVGGRRHRRTVPVTYSDEETGEVLPKIDAPSIADIAIARSNLSQAQEAVAQGEFILKC